MFNWEIFNCPKMYLHDLYFASFLLWNISAWEICSLLVPVWGITGFSLANVYFMSKISQWTVTRHVWLWVISFALISISIFLCQPTRKERPNWESPRRVQFKQPFVFAVCFPWVSVFCASVVCCGEPAQVKCVFDVFYMKLCVCCGVTWLWETFKWWLYIIKMKKSSTVQAVVV